MALAGLIAALPRTGQARPAVPHFKQTDLVSDQQAEGANPADPDLVNPWGIAFSPTHPFWISDNHTGLSTLYDQTGAKQGLRVAIPGPGGVGAGAPTGIVFSGTTAFNGDFFIWATEDGTIAGWKTGATAVIEKDNSASGAVYKGLALVTSTHGSKLFAADFHGNKVDVFDASFNAVTLSSTAFKHRRAPAGFAPFNIVVIKGKLYVSYAKQDADAHDDVGGAGNGFIDIYDTNGRLIRRLASGTAAHGHLTQLNSPWGMAIAPKSFGKLKNALLVGQFQSGQIVALNANSGSFLGLLTDSNNAPITIDGLWALVVGGGGASGDPNKVYFTAGPEDETHGLFGSLEAS